MTDRVDLLVAGAGGGLVGAVRAAELGLSVVVVEANRSFRHSNNTAMSTAMIPGAGSRFQRAAGLTDSPDAFVADVMRKTNGAADPVATRALATVSARLVEWLADSLGLPIELVTDFEYPGHSIWRCHTVPGRSGATLLAAIAQAASKRGIDILTPARLESVRRDGGGLSARVGYPDGGAEEIGAHAVLLATNGFGAAPDLVATHIPEMAGAHYHGSAESRGDALRIGAALGARTGFLDAYQGHGGLAADTGTLVGWATVMHGGIVVNGDGARFADETRGYSEFARLQLAQPGGRSAVVYDERVHKACLAFTDYRQTVEMGAVRWATTIPGVAADLGADASVLARTMSDAAAANTGQRPDPLGRADWGGPPLRPPYAFVRLRPALFHTQGGLAVDEHGQVVGGDGTPLAGLYAAGGAAIGISGHGPDGYLAGNGLLSALGFSMLAAEHAAATRR